MSRTTATHWIVVGPEKGVCQTTVPVERLRPLVRALLPLTTESEVVRVSAQIYKASQETGFTFSTPQGPVTVYRRVMYDFYPQLAQHVTGQREVHPMQADMEAFYNKLRGRKCLA